MNTAAVIVAHPDDETLWCGGLMLEHPEWDWFVLTLCRGSDQDRAPKFANVLNYLSAQGDMDDLDDGPEQEPLDEELVQETILQKLPRTRFDLILTHGLQGEYTRHRRHEECSAAVLSLWSCGRLETPLMKLFGYEDHGGKTLPQVCTDVDERSTLDAKIFARKYHIITGLYGFEKQSWEARTTPMIEGFYCSDSPTCLMTTMQRKLPLENHL